MNTSRPRLALAVVLPLLLVAGCSADEPTSTGDTGDTGTRSASTPAASDGSSYPDEGVDFINLPDLKGAYATALQTYIDFERGRRLAAREGEVGTLLSFNATGGLADIYRRALASYGGDPYVGDVTVEFLHARPADNVLHLDVCVDATALAVPKGAPAVLGEATRAPQRIDVTNLEGPWRVTSAAAQDGTC